MQIIQSIRDKGAAIVIAVIALSLIGFILMDARQGSGKMFAGMNSNVGKVNGESIERTYFDKRVRMLETQEEQKSGQKPSGIRSQQIREQLWNQVVAEKIFYAEAEKLGIDLTAKELSSILLSNDPSNPFLQQGLADQATGRLDVAKAQEALANIKKFKGEQREMVNAEIVDPTKLNTAVAKYSGLLNASVYYPTWMQEKENADAKNFAQISYVYVPFNEISDSSITVTDAEVNSYVQKHKELFKQEEGRMISYASFSQLPSVEDSARVKTYLETLKTSFATDTSAAAFIARNTSVIDFKDEYLPKSKAQTTQLDTISKFPIGTVYGPYVENGNYVIAKILGSKTLPDSVKARHILISLNDEKGQPLRSDSVAKKLADSILTAVNAGADFAALAAKYSSDGSKDKGGDLGTFGYGTMVAEFNEFTFTKPVGSREVVKTQFGYHVVEVLSQKDLKPAYKVALLAKEIAASDVTINSASLKATKASAEKDKKALEAYAAKNGVQLTQVPTIVKENDFSIASLQEARSLVRWIFEANKGDVSEPFSIGDQFIVASVDKIEKEGVQDASTARAGSEVMIRKEKKTVMIKAKLGNNPTIQSVASAYNKQITQAGADSSITFSAQIINGVGLEPKIIGASFNKAYQGKPSPAIGGTNGVYVMQVNNISSKPADTPNEQAQKATARVGALRSQLNNWYEGLKKQATIKDNRSKFY
ncbi:MAG: peptidylprolyl isomerase [Ferruginibacter sp.]